MSSLWRKQLLKAHEMNPMNRLSPAKVKCETQTARPPTQCLPWYEVASKYCARHGSNVQMPLGKKTGWSKRWNSETLVHSRNMWADHPWHVRNEWSACNIISEWSTFDQRCPDQCLALVHFALSVPQGCHIILVSLNAGCIPIVSCQTRSPLLSLCLWCLGDSLPGEFWVQTAGQR